MEPKRPLPDHIAYWRPANRILREIEEMRRQADRAERSTS